MFYILISLFILATTECAILFQEVVSKYKNDIVLNCSLTNANITFYKTDITGKNSSQIIPDGSKYLLTNTTLTIKHTKKADFTANYLCNNSVGDLINFNQKVIPHLFNVDALTLNSIEGYDVEITCHLLLAPYNESVNWTWSLNKQIIESDARISFRNLDNINSTIVIKNARIEESGNYFCRAWNEYGWHERNVTLKIKSRLAPLWPFLGVLGEFSIIALIIGLYEFSVKKKTQNNGNPKIISPENENENEGIEKKRI